MFFSFFHYIGWIIFNIIGRLFLNLEVRGQKNLDNLDGGGVIFIANHHGMLDPFLIGAGIPTSYLSSIKCFRYFTYYKYITRNPFGFLIWILGAYPVYPSKSNLERTLKKTIEILKDDQSVLMFPTGKRRKHFDVKDTRPGIGYLAKALNPLIVPVFIENTYGVKLRDFILCTRKIIVTFGKPFHPRDITEEDMSLWQGAEVIMKRVQQLQNN